MSAASLGLAARSAATHKGDPIMDHVDALAREASRITPPTHVARDRRCHRRGRVPERVRRRRRRRQWWRHDDRRWRGVVERRRRRRQAAPPRRPRPSSGSGGGGGGDLVAQLGIEEASAGKGKAVDLGAVLALTGTGSYYGKTMTRGLDLGAKHIAELGGPTFNYTYLDHKSGDPAAGVQAMAELVAKGVQMKFASYGDDIGAMLSPTTENKVFTLDGGGGTGIFAQGKPYFWGTRAITPNDTLPGVFRWFKENYPDKKTVGVMGWDAGAEINEITKKDILQKISRCRARVQRAVRAGADRGPGLLAGDPEDQGQRARPAADRPLRPGPRVVLQPGGDRRAEGAADGLRVHPGRPERVEGHVRLGGLHLLLRLLRSEEPEEPARQEVRRGLQQGIRRGSGLLRRQLLRERVRDVGDHAADLEGRPRRRAHRRDDGQGAAGRTSR